MSANKHHHNIIGAPIGKLAKIYYEVYDRFQSCFIAGTNSELIHQVFDKYFEATYLKQISGKKTWKI